MSANDTSCIYHSKEISMRLQGRVTGMKSKGLFRAVSSPHTLVLVYTGLIRPVTSFLAPTQWITQRQIAVLVRIEHTMLCSSLCVPHCAKRDLLSLICGVPPMKCFIHMHQIRWYCRRVCMDTSTNTSLWQIRLRLILELKYVRDKQPL